MSGVQKEIFKRMVPYFVWSNADFDRTVFQERVSMVDLVPLLLKAVDIPLTGYQKEIIKLNKLVPIRTSIGYYMDSQNQIMQFDQDDETYDIIQNYYYLEYNNLVHADDYNSSWFELQQK